MDSGPIGRLADYYTYWMPVKDRGVLLPQDVDTHTRAVRRQVKNVLVV
jgi:homospermidine synthase